MLKLCSFEGCKRKVNCKGLCSTHYQMQLRGEPLRPIGAYRASRKANDKQRKFTGQSSTKRACKAALCKNIAGSRGYCRLHFNQSCVQRSGRVSKDELLMTRTPVCDSITLDEFFQMLIHKAPRESHET